MAKQIQLNIAEPCHENWDNMTKAEKGRFCGSCQKQVIDFTDMSDSEIAVFFKKPSTGSVCGRFMNDQLERDIAIPKKRIPWIKYFFQLTLPLFLSSLKSNAQKGKVAVTHTDSAIVAHSRKTVGFVTNARFMHPGEIVGRVIDEEGKPVSFASVMIKGTQAGVSADSNGLFKLRMPLETNKTILAISSAGFIPGEAVVTEKSIRENEVLIVRLKKPVLSEVVVNSYGYSRRMGNVTAGAVCVVNKVKTNKIKPVPVTNIPPAMRIFPNPVLSGSAININFNKMEESYYSVQLLTLSGQVAFHKEMWIDKEARVLNMTIPQVTAGIYVLRMTSRQSGKTYSDKIVIE